MSVERMNLCGRLSLSRQDWCKSWETLIARSGPESPHILRALRSPAAPGPRDLVDGWPLSVTIPHFRQQGVEPGLLHFKFSKFSSLAPRTSQCSTQAEKSHFYLYFHFCTPWSHELSHFLIDVFSIFFILIMSLSYHVIPRFSFKNIHFFTVYISFVKS